MSLLGGTLGEVLVTVGIDTKNLEQGLAKAKREAESSGHSFTQLGVAAKAALAVATVAVVKFAADSVQAFNSYEASVANLGATLQNNNMIVDKSTAVFEQYARSLSRTTGFTQQQIISAQSLFAQYGLNVDQVEALTQVSIAYARTTGKDLAASAAGLGKALLGSGRAVKAIGQDFVDTGTLAGNYDEIIHRVGNSVEGASKAFSETGAGALAQFGAAWDTLKIAFGESLGGPIGATLRFITQFLTELPGVIGTVENAFIDMANVVIMTSNAVARGINLFFPGLLGLRDHIEEVDHSIEGLTPTLGLAGTKFGFVGRQVYDVGQSFQQLKDRTKELTDTFVLQMDGLGSVKKGWELTTGAAVRGSGIIAEKQKVIANELKALDKLNIGEGLKKQLLALGPDMVHAFITGSHGQQQKILANLKVYSDAVKETAKIAKTLAQHGGEAVGHALMDGVVKGIAAGRGAVTKAAQDAVAAIIAAARERARARSPSKVMEELGKDLMRGLQAGIENAAPLIVKAMEKIIDRFKEWFGQIKAHFQDFRNSIRGGIAGFKDLFGSISGLFGQTDAEGNPIQVTGDAIAAAVQAQVAQARELARTLKQLAKAGLSQQLLSQLAGQGAEGIAQGQALLANPELIAQLNEAQQAITQVAQAASDNLGERFFGQALKRAKNHLDELSDALRELNREMKGPGAIVINMNVAGSVVTESDLLELIRRAVQRNAARNAFASGF